VVILKVLLIGTSKFGGGYLRVNAFYKFLKSYGHEVDVVTIPGKDSNRMWYYYYSSLHLTIKDFPYLVKKIGEKLEKIIKSKNYDVVIAVETLFSYVLTKEINCLKLFSCESLESEERYYNKGSHLEEIHRIRDIEYEIFDNSDYVIFPWDSTEKYVRKYIYNDKKIKTIKYGCYPTDRCPSYFYPVSIISLGSLKFYWSNKSLLSHLTEISPYIIDVYGKYKPENKYNINYKGFAESLDIVYNYQFGLNTISRDTFRKNHFSSRVISYLGYGLPVLYPDWQEFPKELHGCIPYNDDNFVEIIDKNSEKEIWMKKSLDAKNQGRLLSWDTTLLALEELIAKE
jgi:hypothetical protein